jgi:Mg-chelatase subunit ChlD/uncharacterized membrane protein
MSLTDPFWLVLAIPLAMLLWVWRLPSRWMFGLRCAASVLLLLAMCGLCVILPMRCGTVVVVMDRSLSMPSNAEPSQIESADLVHSAMASGEKLAVVSFGEKAAVEQSPQGGSFAKFSAEVGRDASNLADGIDMALSLIDKDAAGRVLVLSDGQWTGRDVSSAAARAAAAGVAIDYRALERSSAGDLAIDRVQAPIAVMPGESFMITAWIESPVSQSVKYTLRRGSQTIATGTQSVSAGATRLAFRDMAVEQGTREYVLEVEGQGADPIPENNKARLVVGIGGARPILFVSPTKASGLPALLGKGGVNVDYRAASQCQWTLEELAGYSAVLLENTPASSIGHVGMRNLASWVGESGGGLMLTGGRSSFGPGGYYKSPLEPVLPVSMELRREHRKLAMAIVVALDRSGSMSMTVPGGETKIHMADLASAEVVAMLSAMDQFGCIAVDSAVHEIVPLSDVVNKDAMRGRILQIDSMGGGIFIYEALANAARMIQPAQAGTKHIILFADAADSEQPGDYKTLVEKCAKAGITISVIGLGTEKDCDAELLKDIARRGGGQCMFTNVAQELPRLFAQDTFAIARNAFLDDPVAIQPTGGFHGITQQPLGEFARIGGYNLCYARPGCNEAVVSQDEYHAPIVAAWQAGLGRVLCYTGEADGKDTGDIARWKNVGSFFTSLARWTGGKSQGLGKDLVATQDLRNGACRIELHMDPSRESPPFARMPEVSVLAARPDEAAAASRLSMQWASADMLLAEIPIKGGQTILPTVDVPDKGQVTLAPMCLPFSPEYAPQKPGRGLAALEQMAKSTGGCQRVNLATIWADIPHTPRKIPLAPYLLLAAATVFLVEVFQRRTGMLSGRWRFFEIAKREVGKRTQGLVRSAWKAKRKRQAAPSGPVPSAPPIEPAASAEPTASPVATPAAPKDVIPVEDDMTDALGQAQRRARARTQPDSRK